MTSALYGVVLGLITQLNEPDRQYVATPEPAADQIAAENSKQSADGPELIVKARGLLPSPGDLSTGIQSLGRSTDQKLEVLPATMVWLRLSKGYLQDYVERSVDRKKPVRDYILGTTITGESHTVGKTRLLLHPSDSQALGEVEFVGTVHARTIGRNGPATLHYLSDSKFRARKRLKIDESGLSALPAIAEAPTRLTPTSIRTSLPRLRGQIAERIAWRRVANTRSQADAIASDHTADDIRHDLDRKINESVAAIQKTVHSQIADLKLDGEARPLLMRSRSTPEYIEVVMYRSGATPEEMRMQPSPVEGNPDIAVRVHRTILARALSDARLREKFAPVLAGLLETRIAPETVTVLPKAEQTPQNSTEWSMGLDWLTFDFRDSKRQRSSLRVAVKDDLQGRRTK
jgi:hypothetical protein